MNEIQNNKVNLCDSCSQVYPDCTSKPENVFFGDGAGHDNICACSEYQPETHEERTETHACDCVSGVAAIVAAIEAVDEWDGGYNVQRANMIRDAIKALPSAQPDDEETNYWHEKANSYEQTLVRLSQSIAEQPQQWIPVTERLPEEDVEVLITYRYKEGEGDTSHAYIDITTYGQMYFGGNKVGDHKHWRQPFEYFTSNYEVVAWMPLPEPYAERGQDGQTN